MNLALGQGLGRLTCQVLPPHFYGYRRYCPYTAEPSASGAWSAPDLARARQLVRSSGTAGQAVTVWIPKRIHTGAGAGRYVVTVLDRLGYKARFRFAADPYTAKDALRTQAGFYGWGPDFASSPGGLIDTALTCGVTFENGNTTQFCDPAIDRETTRAQSLQTSDPEAATRLWAKIDRDITWQAPWVSFANGVKLEVTSTRVGNYQYNPQWGTLLDQLWVR